jgi:hypothetical protein
MRLKLQEVQVAERNGTSANPHSKSAIDLNVSFSNLKGSTKLRKAIKPFLDHRTGKS